MPSLKKIWIVRQFHGNYLKFKLNKHHNAHKKFSSIYLFVEFSLTLKPDGKFSRYIFELDIRLIRDGIKHLE